MHLPLVAQAIASCRDGETIGACGVNHGSGFLGNRQCGRRKTLEFERPQIHGPHRPRRPGSINGITGNRCWIAHIQKRGAGLQLIIAVRIHEHRIQPGVVVATEGAESGDVRISHGVGTLVAKDLRHLPVGSGSGIGPENGIRHANHRLAGIDPRPRSENRVGVQIPDDGAVQHRRAGVSDVKPAAGGGKVAAHDAIDQRGIGGRTWTAQQKQPAAVGSGGIVLEPAIDDQRRAVTAEKYAAVLVAQNVAAVQGGAVIEKFDPGQTIRDDQTIPQKVDIRGGIPEHHAFAGVMTNDAILHRHIVPDCEYRLGIINVQSFRPAVFQVQPIKQRPGASRSQRRNGHITQRENAGGVRAATADARGMRLPLALAGAGFRTGKTAVNRRAQGNIIGRGRIHTFRNPEVGAAIAEGLQPRRQFVVGGGPTQSITPGRSGGIHVDDSGGSHG